MTENQAALSLDLLYDEGFPQDPYLSGRLRVEMERMGYGGRTATCLTCGGDGDDPTFRTPKCGFSTVPCPICNGTGAR